MAVVGATISVPQAYASDMSVSLARMDAIIKEMQSLRAEFASLSSAATVPAVTQKGNVLGAQATAFFTQKLELGETNSDIKKIQKLLATDKEIYPYGVSSGMFGPKTTEGIKNFQTRFGIKPLGIVGPSTKALLEVFIAAYPDDIYPADVLKKKPTVVHTSVAQPETVTTVQPAAPLIIPTPSVSSLINPPVSIVATKDAGGEAKVRIKYQDGTNKLIIVTGTSNTEIVDSIKLRTGLSSAQILGVITFDAEKKEVSNNEVKSVAATIQDGEASVKVKYTNGDTKKFTVSEEKKSKIINAVADKLGVDASAVSDVISFTTL